MVLMEVDQEALNHLKTLSQSRGNSSYKFFFLLKNVCGICWSHLERVRECQCEILLCHYEKKRITDHSKYILNGSNIVWKYLKAYAERL